MEGNRTSFRFLKTFRRSSKGLLQNIFKNLKKLPDIYTILLCLGFQSFTASTCGATGAEGEMFVCRSKTPESTVMLTNTPNNHFNKRKYQIKKNTIFTLLFEDESCIVSSKSGSWWHAGLKWPHYANFQVNGFIILILFTKMLFYYATIICFQALML